MTKTPKWVALGLCVFVLCGCLRRRLTAADVVYYAQEAIGETSACHFVLDIEIETDMFGDSLTIEVWEAPKDRLKIRVLSAENPQLQDLTFTTDGRQSLSYSAQANEVMTGPADVVKMPSIIQDLVFARREWIQAGDASQAKVLSRERENGLVVYRIGMPLTHGGYAQYWIDAHQWWIMRMVFEDEFLGTGTIQIRDLEVFRELPTARFDLDIPDDATITEIPAPESPPLTLEEAQKIVSFPLHTPTFLPAGAQFTAAYQIDKNIALVYSGLHAFTLVQGPNPETILQSGIALIPLRGQQARLGRDEKQGGLLLTWREDELHFALSGALSEQDLIRIAESLKPGL